MKDVPDGQVAGRAVKPVTRLLSLLHGPALRSRNENVPLPVPRIAIQYFVPEVIVNAGTLIVFHAAGLIVVILPCVNSVPGCPALSEYSPALICLTVAELST